jgi:hypothetical protein
MLADQLDYIVGVDPQRDTHSLAVVHVVSGVVVVEATVGATSNGYAEALKFADEHARPPSWGRAPPSRRRGPLAAWPSGEE